MINLEIVNPKGTNYKEEVKTVQVKTIEGNIGILPGHIPFISLIQNGYVKFNDQEIKIKDGIIHFEDDDLYISYIE